MGSRGLGWWAELAPEMRCCVGGAWARGWSGEVGGAWLERWAGPGRAGQVSSRQLRSAVPSQLRHAAADDEVRGGEERRGQAHQPLHSAHRCHCEHGRCRALPVCGCSVYCTAQSAILGLREDYHYPVSARAAARTPKAPDPSLENGHELGGAAPPPQLLPLPSGLSLTSPLLPQGHRHSIQCGRRGHPRWRCPHFGHHPRGDQPAGSRHLLDLGCGLASVSVVRGFGGLRGTPEKGDEQEGH